jgi:hypothetical protein
VAQGFSTRLSHDGSSHTPPSFSLQLGSICVPTRRAGEQRIPADPMKLCHTLDVMPEWLLYLETRLYRSVPFRSQHDEPPDAFGLRNALDLVNGRQALLLSPRGPHRRWINSRIRRDVADRFCVARDHEHEMRIAGEDCEAPSSARVQT